MRLATLLVPSWAILWRWPAAALSLATLLGSPWADLAAVANHNLEPGHPSWGVLGRTGLPSSRPARKFIGPRQAAGLSNISAGLYHPTGPKPAGPKGRVSQGPGPLQPHTPTVTTVPSPTSQRPPTPVSHRAYARRPTDPQSHSPHKPTAAQFPRSPQLHSPAVPTVPTIPQRLSPQDHRPSPTAPTVPQSNNSQRRDSAEGHRPTVPQSPVSHKAMASSTRVQQRHDPQAHRLTGPQAHRPSPHSCHSSRIPSSSQARLYGKSLARASTVAATDVTCVRLNSSALGGSFVASLRLSSSSQSSATL